MRLSVYMQLLFVSICSAHILATYPLHRGNNFITNETFPYGMQWMQPCGGVPLTTNRSYYPISGGPVAFQPGWFSGHATAALYINIGFDTDGLDGGPLNFMHPLVQPWTLIGPSNAPFPGTVCVEHVPIPYADLGLSPGQNATIQIIELAAHGASLYSCSDVILVDDDDARIPPVNDTVCFNSTSLGSADIHTRTFREPRNDTSDESSASLPLSSSIWQIFGWLPLLIATTLLL